MHTKRHQDWFEVKAKIIRRFGSIKACAAAIDVTSEAIRLTVQGKCPHTKKKLEAVLK